MTPRYLLDTDHISVLQRRAAPQFLALANRIALHSQSELAFSVVSFHEQALGAHTFITRARTTADLIRGYALLSEIIRGFSAAPVLPFDAAAAAEYSDLQGRGVRVATMDLRIAATARSRGLILLTRNARDFSRVPNLVIEDWTT